MRASQWAVAVLAAALLGGCLGAQSANPNLAAPKLVVQPLADGNVTIYVHSAFGERQYEWISVSLDNETVVNRTSAFSVEHVAPALPLYVEVRAQAKDEMFWLRARFAADPDEAQRVRASLRDDEGRWGDERAYNTPFERVLDRRPGE